MVAAMSCAKDAKEDRCIAGKSSPCACTNGATGAQVCTASGTFEPCVCEAPATTPAPVVPVDAGALQQGASSEAPSAGSAASAGKEKKPTESWYRSCVRQGIQQHIRQNGSRSDLKGAEQTAIFACEMTMGCSGQRECDAKAARSAKAQRDALGKWK